MEVKITKILGLRKSWDSRAHQHYWNFSGIHFKVDNKDYFLYAAAPEYEPITVLYKGRMKSHLETLAGSYGYPPIDTLQFSRKPKCLKYIDTAQFIKAVEKFVGFSFKNK